MCPMKKSGKLRMTLKNKLIDYIRKQYRDNLVEEPR